MKDTKSITTTSTDTNSLKVPVSDTASTPPATAPVATTGGAKTTWRDKFHIGSKAEKPGKEKWRDASLSEEKRWKDWQKAKDREQKNGGATGVFTQPYKAKGVGKWGYWLAL